MQLNNFRLPLPTSNGNGRRARQPAHHQLDSVIDLETHRVPNSRSTQARQNTMGIERHKPDERAHQRPTIANDGR